MPSSRTPRPSLADRFKRPPRRPARRRGPGDRPCGGTAPGLLEIEFELEDPGEPDA